MCPSCDALYLRSCDVAKALQQPETIIGRLFNKQKEEGTGLVADLISELDERLLPNALDDPAEYQFFRHHKMVQFLQYCLANHLRKIDGSSADMMWMRKNFGTPPYLQLPASKSRIIFLFRASSWKWAVSKKGLRMTECLLCDTELSSDHVLFSCSYFKVQRTKIEQRLHSRDIRGLFEYEDLVWELYDLCFAIFSFYSDPFWHAR